MDEYFKKFLKEININSNNIEYQTKVITTIFNTLKYIQSDNIFLFVNKYMKDYNTQIKMIRQDKAPMEYTTLIFHFEDNSILVYNTGKLAVRMYKLMENNKIDFITLFYINKFGL